MLKKFLCVQVVVNTIASIPEYQLVVKNGAELGICNGRECNITLGGVLPVSGWIWSCIIDIKVTMILPVYRIFLENIMPCAYVINFCCQILKQASNIINNVGICRVGGAQRCVASAYVTSRK